MVELLQSVPHPMPLWGSTLTIVVAAALLAASANWIVESAVRLARDLQVSATLIGLTVVALGTSAPEFAVTLVAAFDGRGSIAIGNVVGSNIFNLGFILGGIALVRPFQTSAHIVWRDGLVLAAATIALLAFVGRDLTLGRGEGLFLSAGLVAYLWYLVSSRGASRPTDPPLTGDPPDPPSESRRRLALEVCRLVGAIALIVVSAHMLVFGGTSVATTMGLSDWVIGVTIIAAGTSLPEFATSLVAVMKGRYGLSLGNIIGSDIFNVLGVLGLTGLIRAVEVDASATVSLVGLCVMVLVTVLFMRTGWRLSRKEGFVLVALASARWFLDLTSGV